MTLSRSTFAAATFAAAALAGLSMAGGDAVAQQSFYAGKTINIVVGFSPGGGYDTYARLMARFIGKYIPGNPNVVVQNMPGAGSLTAVMALDATLPKDGTSITAFNPGLLIQSMTIPDKVKTKFTEYAWLGSMSDDVRVCYMWGKLGVKTFDDMLKRNPLVMGDTGPGSSSFVNQKMLQQIFGMNLKQILGYPGSAEKRLAIERGELDGDCGSWSSLPDDWVRDKAIDVTLRFQKKSPKGLPEGITYGGDRIKDPEKMKLYELLNSSSEVGRPYIMSKAVPADRVAIVRAAFEKAMADPELLAEAEKQRLLVSLLTGPAVEEMLKGLAATPASVVAAAKAITGD